MTVAVTSSVIRRFLAEPGDGPIVAKTSAADRAKDTAKIDLIPFLPTHSAFCRRAELLLLAGIPFAGLVATLALTIQVATR